MDEKGRKIPRGNAMTTGLLFGAAKIAFDVAKPMLLRIFMRRAEDFVSERWPGED